MVSARSFPARVIALACLGILATAVGLRATPADAASACMATCKASQRGCRSAAVQGFKSTKAACTGAGRTRKLCVRQAAAAKRSASKDCTTGRRTCGHCCADPATCCTPQCTGKACGADGCGGSCGACPTGQTCNAAGQCDGGSCTPDCAGKVCGADGCGGSCGTCPAGKTCDASGHCAGGGCTPQCTGRACGTDGCGGSCGACPVGQTCDAAGQCICTPNCAGRTCGPDGCGGSCGGCPAGKSCDAAGQCICTPDCTGRTCGPDGCGSSCGSCPAGKSCDLSGHCVGGSCTPQCAGKVCGADGCGGVCGTCAAHSTCSADRTQCVCDNGYVPDPTFTRCIQLGGSCTGTGVDQYGYCTDSATWVWCDPRHGLTSMNCPNNFGTQCYRGQQGSTWGACGCGAIDMYQGICGNFGASANELHFYCSPAGILFVNNCKASTGRASGLCSTLVTAYGWQRACFCEPCVTSYQGQCNAPVGSCSYSNNTCTCG